MSTKGRAGPADALCHEPRLLEVGPTRSPWTPATKCSRQCSHLPMYTRPTHLHEHSTHSPCTCRHAHRHMLTHSQHIYTDTCLPLVCTLTHAYQTAVKSPGEGGQEGDGGGSIAPLILGAASCCPLSRPQLLPSPTCQVPQVGRGRGRAGGPGSLPLLSHSPLRDVEHALGWGLVEHATVCGPEPAKDPEQRTLATAVGACDKQVHAIFHLRRQCHVVPRGARASFLLPVAFLIATYTQVHAGAGG